MFSDAEWRNLNLALTLRECGFHLPRGCSSCCCFAGRLPLLVGKNSLVSIFCQITIASGVGRGWNVQCLSRIGCFVTFQYCGSILLPLGLHISERNLTRKNIRTWLKHLRLGVEIFVAFAACINAMSLSRYGLSNLGRSSMIICPSCFSRNCCMHGQKSIGMCWHFWLGFLSM